MIFEKIKLGLWIVVVFTLSSALFWVYGWEVAFAAAIFLFTLSTVNRKKKVAEARRIAKWREWNTPMTWEETVEHAKRGNASNTPYAIGKHYS